MDLQNMLDSLHRERETIDRVISAITLLQQSQAGRGDVEIPKRRRGRKSMNTEERLVVSQRMRKYWADRRYDRETDLALGTAGG